MIWAVLIISIGLASARNVRNVSPEYLESLRSSGQDEEFARLLGVDVSLVRPNSEERAEGSRYNFVSPLGDILLPEEQGRNVINFNKYGGSKWPNGEIPYTISGSDFTQEQRNFITNACNDFNKRVRNLKLVPRRRQRDYVHVISGNGCWSYLGRIGNQQSLSLQSNGCLSNGTVQHEFMHAAGFAHEHNRLDRDEYVVVLWDNIDENWHSQYQKINDQDYSTYESYDYYSVMHYPIWSPGRWWDDAFKIPDGVDRNKLGQDEGVSPGDVDKLNAVYP